MDKYCLFCQRKDGNTISADFSTVLHLSTVQGFTEFRSEYLPLMQKCTSPDIAENTFAKYDAIITDDDQM